MPLGSHLGQQLAHVGVGEVLVFDDDVVEDTNLNRLVGALATDVAAGTRKTTVAKRLIVGVNPDARVRTYSVKWSEAMAALAEAHVVLGAVDSFAERVNLERFCRRHLIPYIDIGMDVIERGQRFEIIGQVALSSPNCPCIQCMGIVAPGVLEQEERARQYGEAGSKPQVVWPNGTLASTAIGLLMQLVTGWHDSVQESVHLEYNGNTHTISPAPRLGMILERGIRCTHYRDDEVGDALYGVF